MKKKVLSLMLILSVFSTLLCACKSEEKIPQTVENETSYQQQEEEESTEHKSKISKDAFWIYNYQFADVANYSNLTLNGLNLPITVNDLDNSYSIRSEIGAIKESDEVIILDEGKISYLDSVPYQLKDSNGNYLFDIIVQNFSEDGLSLVTLTDCLNNDWWYISNENISPETFGISTELEGYYTGHESGLLEEIVKQLGKPSYCKEFYSSDSDDYCSVTYDMIYEFDKFTFILSIDESISSNPENSMLSIIKCEYYNKEAWNCVKEAKYLVWNDMEF